jgi:hypothetical protein
LAEKPVGELKGEISTFHEQMIKRFLHLLQGLFIPVYEAFQSKADLTDMQTWPVVTNY